MPEVLLEIRNLKTYFYTYAGLVKALEGVNLKIFKGDIFGIVGETGCGKSVTVQSILRLVANPGRIIDGEILFKGEDLLKLSEEDIQANDEDTKKDNKRGLKEKVIAALRKVHLPDPERISEQYPHELSGGMRQRAMIATGTSCKPSLFIADEATTFLDVTIGAQILRLFQQMNRDDGATILFITHNLGIIGEICNRVAVMYAGQVVESCTTEELFNSPKHPYTIGLLSAIPRLDVDMDELEEIQGTIPNLIHPPEGCRFNPRCMHAMAVCRITPPHMQEVSEGHYVSCHLFTKGVDEDD